MYYLSEILMSQAE